MRPDSVSRSDTAAIGSTPPRHSPPRGAVETVRGLQRSQLRSRQRRGCALSRSCASGHRFLSRGCRRDRSGERVRRVGLRTLWSRRGIWPGCGRGSRGCVPRPVGEGVCIRQAPKAPATEDEGADVTAHPGGVGVVQGRESVVEARAGFAGSFGDVLGHVRGHGIIVWSDFVDVDWPRVDLVAPAEDEFADRRAVRGVHGYATCGGMNGIGEPVRRCPGRGRIVGTRRAVEADHRMDVHGAASLVFGDPGEGQACVVGEAGLRDAGRGGEVAPHAEGEAVPEFARVRVPQDMRRVVVAVRPRSPPYRCLEGGL